MINNIPEEIADFLQNRFGKVSSFRSASGGCINNGGTIETGNASFFVKWNSSTRFPGMFEAEAKGLDLLREPQSLVVPSVVSHFEGKEHACLVLEQINEGRRSADFWEELGRGLAEIHRQSAPHYGLDHDNYMGSLQQYNQPNSSWIDFFINKRLQPQIALAKDNNKIDGKGLDLFEKLIVKLDQLLVTEQPALVHGDLWSGNFMVGSHGEPVLIDPAVAYAHREIDLAMTTLFGGFDQQFYEAYKNSFPLEPGYENRFDIYNLYPLLIHVNLFGGGYYQQVLSILNRYA